MNILASVNIWRQLWPTTQTFSLTQFVSFLFYQLAKAAASVGTVYLGPIIKKYTASPSLVTSGWSLISPYSAQIWCWMPSCQEHIGNKRMLHHLLEMNIFYLPRAEFKKTLKIKGKEMQHVSSFCQKNNSETQIVSVVCMAPHVVACMPDNVGTCS